MTWFIVVKTFEAYHTPVVPSKSHFHIAFQNPFRVEPMQLQPFAEHKPNTAGARRD
jgi:hypothetical protein